MQYINYLSLDQLKLLSTELISDIINNKSIINLFTMDQINYIINNIDIINIFYPETNFKIFNKLGENVSKLNYDTIRKITCDQYNQKYKYLLEKMIITDSIGSDLILDMLMNNFEIDNNDTLEKKCLIPSTQPINVIYNPMFNNIFKNDITDTDFNCVKNCIKDLMIEMNKINKNLQFLDRNLRKSRISEWNILKIYIEDFMIRMNKKNEILSQINEIVLK